MKTEGLSLENAPPPWVPLAFFATAPLALIVADAVVLAFFTMVGVKKALVLGAPAPVAVTMGVVSTWPPPPVGKKSEIRTSCPAFGSVKSLG